MNTTSTIISWSEPLSSNKSMWVTIAGNQPLSSRQTSQTLPISKFRLHPHWFPWRPQGAPTHEPFLTTQTHVRLLFALKNCSWRSKSKQRRLFLDCLDPWFLLLPENDKGRPDVEGMTRRYPLLHMVKEALTASMHSLVLQQVHLKYSALKN